jgi:ubiquinol-cytochrome c reductase cytochrome b subunit
MGLRKTEATGLVGWVDQRLSIMDAWNNHLAQYWTPKNFNIWYFFGSLALLVLVNQILTGIWLTMSYEPSAEGAFASVEYIMRDVEMGWLIRYMHSTGASAFFVVVYLHMLRGIMYGSYQKPRELIWIFGMTIYLLLMAEAFMGYLLPWGQMSYWGAQVIVSLFSAIPVIGADLAQWVRGDYLISGITLNRFFALHVIALPLVIAGLVVLHILALHEVGSNNPDGIDIKDNKDENGKPLDGIAFHPYYTVKDIAGVAVFLFVFSIVIFFFPEMGGYFLEHANFEPANPLKTPEHIAPVWYFTPFYAMLRAITFPMFGLDAKFWGVVVMGAAIAILFVLPWLDRSPVRSIRYKGNLSKSCLCCSPLPLWFWVCLVLYRRRLFGRRWRKQAQRFTSYSSLPCLGTPDGSRRNLFQRGLRNESRLSLSLFMDVDRSNGSWWSCVPTGVDPTRL